MLHDDGDNKQHYAVVKLEEAARIIRQALNELPVLRKSIDKYKENKEKARETYNDLQQHHGRLLSAFKTAALALLEMELPEMADYSVKLGRSVKAFNLMTPDYSKLCAVLSDYLTKLPISDTPEGKATNAAVIGHLMASVKMGYYPTNLDHIKYLANGMQDIMINVDKYLPKKKTSEEDPN